MDFFRKHKKIVLVVLVVVLLLVFDAAIGFYGMRYLEKSAEQKEAVKVAVKADLDGFCDALESNDIATVKLFCTEDVVTQMGIDMMDADAFCALILDSLSLGEEDLSDEAKNSFDSMKKALKKAVLTGIYYDIEEMAIVKSDDDSVTATLPVRLFGCGSLVNVDFSGEIAMSNAGIVNYASDNLKTLMDFYDAGGEEAVHNDIEKQQIGTLLSAMNAKAADAADASDDAHDWEMTFVVGKDAEGNATSAMLVKAIEQKTDAADGSEE